MGEQQTPTTWQGSLKAKTKVQLFALADQLGVRIAFDALKPELENAIRSKILNTPELHTDPRFKGLYRSFHDASTNGAPSAARRASHRKNPRHSHADADFEPGASPHRDIDPASTASQTPSMELAPPAIPNGDLDDSEVAVALATDIERRLEVAAEETTALVRREVVQVGQLVRSGSRSVSRKAAELAEATREVAVDTVREAQHTLSSPWVLLGMGILAELSYVIISVVPIEPQVLPALRWATYQFTGPEPYIVDLPNLSPLTSWSFISPLSTFLSFSIFLPLLFASIVTFPVLQHHSRRRAHRITPPNAFSFAVARLASVALLQGVFAAPGGYAYGWEGNRFGTGGVGGAGMAGGQDGVGAFAGLQYVSACAGLAFVLHDVVAR